jgi:hypothetical protein
VGADPEARRSAAPAGEAGADQLHRHRRLPQFDGPRRFRGHQKIIETPIHYKARTFGETQISRFRSGWLLLTMVWFAYCKLKAI